MYYPNIPLCVCLYHSIPTLGDLVYLEKYQSVYRELELLKQQKNSEYDEELDDLRATKRNLERKVMNIVIELVPFLCLVMFYACLCIWLIQTYYMVSKTQLSFQASPVSINADTAEIWMCLSI